MRQKYNFIGASMHKDADERLVPQGKYIDANNIRIVNGDGGDAGVVKKYKGTTAIETFSSSEATLGMLEHKRVLYIFVLNESTGNTELYKYDIASDTKTLLMSMDLGNEASDAPFDMNIVDDEDVQGTEKILLYWNDRRNEIQKVNISILSGDDTYYSAQQDIALAKPSSLEPPTTVGSSSSGVNNLKDKNFRFATRYRYEDGEISPLSPISGDSLAKEDYEYKHTLSIFFEDSVTGNIYYKYSKDGANTLNASFLTLSTGATVGETFYATSTYYDPLLLGTAPYAAIMTTPTASGDATFLDSDGLSINMADDAYPYSFAKNREWINIPRETNSVLIAGGYIDTNEYPVIWKLNRVTEKFDQSYITTSFSFNTGYGWTGLASSEYGDVIYASYQTDSGQPSKVLASFDSGATYTEIHDTVSAAGSAIGCTSDGSIAYFAEIVANGTASGDYMEVSFYKCTDKATFNKCSTTTIYLLGEPKENYSSKVYTSSDGVIVYLIISANDNIGDVNYLLRSIDGGKTFQQMGGDGTEGLNRDGVTVDFSIIRRLSVNTFGNVVQFNFQNSIYSSDDYGETWTEIQSSLDSGNIAPFGLESAQQEEIKGRDFLENINNEIEVSFDSGNKYVDFVELYGIDRDNGNFFLIKSYDKDKESISDGATISHTFKNDGIYQVLSESQQNRLFDNIPKSQQTFTIAENRLIIGGYKDGNVLDFENSSSTTVELVSYVYASDNYKTLKTDTIQSYGILYKDVNGRPFSVFPIGDIEIPHWADSDYQVFKAKVTIDNLPPTDAYTASIVRKKPIFDYDVVYRFEDAEARDGKIYLLLPADVNAEVGYKLTYSGDGLDFANVNTSFSIIETVDNSDQSLRLNLSEGKWIAINDPQIDKFNISSVVSGTSNYLSGCFYIHKQQDTDDDIVYYETPYVFKIIGGYHIGNTQNQTIAQPAIIDLDNDYDTIIKKYPYREEYKLSNLTRISTLGRAWIESDDINVANRYSSLCWSDLYVSDNNYNGLSNFNPLSRKTIPTKHGTINKIHYNYSDLFVLQDDIASIIPVNKNILFGADGGTQLRESSNVLGTFNPIKSLHGCTSPESFSYWGEWIFYADKRRGKVMLVSGDSLSIVSDMGMNNYFRDALLGETGKIYSCYNPQTKCFMLGLPSKGKTAIFRPDVGFVCFQDIILGVAQNDKYYSYSVNGFTLFSHDTNNTLNYLYGSQKNASITLSANQESSIIKMWLAVMQETSSPWDLTLINTEQTTTIDSWEKRELFYFSEMPMAISSASSDTTMATEGVGLTQSVSGNDITIQNKIPRVVYVGDTLWSLIDGVETEVGEIAAINGNIVSILALLNTPALGDFCYIRKNNYIDGDVIRDYYAKVTLTHDGDGETELYAINFEVKESKQ